MIAAKTTVAHGSITANPNPIQVFEYSGKGMTVLSWASVGSETVEVRVGAPDGILFSRTGPSGSQATGKWVNHGMSFYLQDVSDGKTLTSENTLASVTVKIKKGRFIDNPLKSILGSEIYGWIADVCKWNILYNFKRLMNSAGHSILSFKKKDENGVFGKYKKIVIIRINHYNAGLFAYFIFVLNQLKYCEERNYFPVVFFGQDSADGKNAYFDPAYGDNMWDYYFEPVLNYTYADVQKMIQNPDNPLTEKDLTQLSNDDLWYLHLHHPASIYGYPYGFYMLKQNYDATWYQKQRTTAHHYVKKYIRVKPHIMEKVDGFYDKKMKGHHVLGIHLRGTDKGTAATSSKIMRVVPPDVYIDEIEKYSKKNANCKIFIATDQAQYLEIMKNKYGDRVLAYECIRSESKLNAFQFGDSKNYEKGEEALIDCLLLSKCHFLLKCVSHLSETAMYFNPNLACLDLNFREW